MDISELKKKKDPGPLKRHPWELARGEIILDLIRRSGKRPVIHIADIGSGDGYVISLLAERQVADRYSAFDNALDTEMLTSLRLTLDRRIDFFSNLQEEGVSILPEADLLLILDVLEHVPDEQDFLTSVKKAINIRPDARWIITVPAFQSLFSHHDSLLGHYRRYTLSRLTGLCKKNNLVPVEKGYFFLSLLFVRILQKNLHRISENKNSDTVQAWKGGNRITRLFTLLLRIDYKIGVLISNIGINIPGLSCYCICHQLQ